MDSIGLWCKIQSRRNAMGDHLEPRDRLIILKWVDVTFYLVFAGYLVTRWQWNARYAIGMGMGVIGFALWMVARAQLGASFSVRAQASELVTTGVYSKIRHPIYFFAGLGYVGLFIALGKIVPLAAFVILYSLQLLRIKKEEAVLEEAFGEDYSRYKASTWF
jgi:protein-S-isoprenylcysteine O-methyltransferase Ste14